MFARGTRFPTAKASEVPGPNAYDPQDPEYDAYKKGALLETADRFTKDSPSDIPGPGGRITPEPTKNMNGAKVAKPPAKTSSADRYAMLQRKVEELERIHQEGKKTHQAEVEKFKQELSRAQRSSQEHAERYDKLKKQSELLESRVQELKKLQDSSHSELKDLRAKLRVSEHERTQLSSKQGEAGDAKKALQALDGKRRDELRERDKKIAELEKALSVERKKRELLEARNSELQAKFDEKAQQVKDRTSESQKELLEAHAGAARAVALQKRAEDKEEELLGQLEQHRQLIARVAEEYGRLASTSVPKPQHDHVKADLAASQLRQCRLERKLANTEGQVQDLASLIRQYKEEGHLLAKDLSAAESMIATYSAALRAAFRERPQGPSEDLALREALFSLQQASLQADLADQRFATVGAGAWSDLYRHRMDALLLHSDFLLKHLVAKDQQLKEQSEQAIAAEAKASNLQKSFAALRSEHDGLRQHLADSVAKLAEANGALEVTKKAHTDLEVRTRADLAKAEQSLAVEKEANKRLASSVHKGKQAEEALQADVEQLTNELTEAEQYRDAYFNVLHELEVLVQRNALAEEEAQRLSKFNAEIVGHNNPAQRIVYLDKIRRELHETKQQLLVTQRDRDAVVNDNDDLRHELELYKSVAVPTEYKPRTHVTRVTRVPLGDKKLNVGSLNVPQEDEEDVFRHIPDTTEYKDGDLTLDEIM